ncbi:MAG TPA: marine proteobacterial sortase target protein [Gammaproteobacteria bacterium]|nr:marine proteobacterial sortase target protein [Gammaproteobacteria bacterium]
MNSLPVFYLRRARSRRLLCQITAQHCLLIMRKSLFVIGVYILAGLLMQGVYAGIDNTAGRINPYDSTHGAVWLRVQNPAAVPAAGAMNNPQAYMEALQMQTDVDIRINGPIARTRLTQRFQNNSGYWMEGLYVFPLPEKAAVDHFRLLIGERIIEGQVKERAAARKTYEKAKAAGRKTGLVEQQRPNVFSTSLANIAPGESIRVEIEYQQLLEYRDEQYRLRFPMTVGERYDPHAGTPSAWPYGAYTPGSGSRQPSGNPVVETRVDEQGNSNPTRIHVLLDAGVSLEDLHSSYHRVNITQTSEHRFSIATVGENIVSDRDFELVWKPQLINSPQLTGFSENINGEDYTLLTILPPAPAYVSQRLRARDLVFVLDISGSMSGTSIKQAKAALVSALGRLRSIDRFNIIWFNDKSGTAFPDFVPAERKYIDFARDYVQRLEAGGGTEMLDALQKALARQQAWGRFRQVVFLTDGHISNEEALFRLIDRQLGDSRLFTVGIGSAPNSYFMRKAAIRGRGSFTYIGNVNEVQEKTEQLFARLENPALVNIEIDIDRQRYEVFPSIIPDLYAGETTSILVRGSPVPENLSLTGDYAGTEWQAQIAAQTQRKAVTGNAIRIAWAREKLASLMTLYHEPAADKQRERIKQEVIDTAVEHHLVSRFTSLVAVDITPVNREALPLQQRLRNNRPHGWQKPAGGTPATAFQLAMMRLPQTATPARQQFRNALVLLALAMMLALPLYRHRRQQGGEYV